MEMCIFVMSLVVLAGFSIMMKIIGDLVERLNELSSIVDGILDMMDPPSEMDCRRI